MSASCIACNSTKTILIGRLPVFSNDFLGKPLDDNVDAGSLYRCGNCALWFRSPMPTPEDLLAYYGGLSQDEWWHHGPERQVWGYVKDLLNDLPHPSVLDVGCFRGDMLKNICDGLDVFGVEPSVDARREAESRGIKIIANSIESLAKEERRFGAITLIDVAEHLTKPLEALRTLTHLLHPGGKLIIFTGSTAAWSWRFARQYYWYSAMPEHVAFFRPSWFLWAAPEVNCSVSSIEKLAYQPSPLRVRIDESLKNFAFVTYRRLEGFPGAGSILRRTPLIRVGRWPSCWWTSARDHILVTLSKPGNG